MHTDIECLHCNINKYIKTTQTALIQEIIFSLKNRFNQTTYFLINTDRFFPPPQSGTQSKWLVVLAYGLDWQTTCTKDGSIYGSFEEKNPTKIL